MENDIDDLECDGRPSSNSGSCTNEGSEDEYPNDSVLPGIARHTVKRLDEMCIALIVDLAASPPMLPMLQHASEGVLSLLLEAQRKNHPGHLLGERMIAPFLTSSVTRLDLSRATQLPNAAVTLVADRCPNLKQLSLEWCAHVFDSGVIAVASKCSQIETLNLRACALLTDASIRELPQRLPALSELNLSFLGQITDDSVSSIGLMCTSLRRLDLSECTALTDASIQAVVCGCTHLTHLNLSGCSTVASSTVATMSASCPHLEHIVLSFCHKVDDEAILALAASPSLRSLDVASCVAVTHAAVCAIGEQRTPLHMLNVCMCPEVTATSLIFALQECEALVDLHYSGGPQVSPVEGQILTEMLMHRQTYPRL